MMAHSPPRRPRLLAIADDLTGALEVGAKFAACGLAAVVGAEAGTGTGAGSEAEVVVLDTETRHLEPARAAAIVARRTGAEAGLEAEVVVLDTETRHLEPARAAAIVARRAGVACGLIYKKTDSTLRGNIGAELGALARARPQARIAYVPAYPALGRTVRGGRVFVDGRPLEETAFGCDPLNPVASSRVASVLEPGCDCVVFDGETEEEVARAAEAILGDASFGIVAGPAAIAEALARRLAGSDRPRPPVWPRVATCLVVNGSLHPASAEQVRQALSSGVVSEDRRAAWRLFRGAPREGVAPLEVARDTGRLVCEELDERPRDAVVVFGGDTAFGILVAMGLAVLRPIGEILPGVPVAAIEGRAEVFIAKAGGFGPPGLLAALQEALEAHGRAG